jgi:hypothetical protein
MKNFFHKRDLLAKASRYYTKKNLLLASVALVILFGSVYGIYRYRQWLYRDENLTLSRAAKVGEVTTHKLMVQIEEPRSAQGRYERGDIVMATPGDKEFSEAEKGGFLILRMDITEKQAEILMRSLMEKTGEKDELGKPIESMAKRRKHAIDLSEIGIAADDFRGREMTDKIWKWDIVIEKDR